VLSLNRSSGLLPAHRGVKSDGLYRWIRHPLYSTYLLAHVGYLASNLSWANFLVVVTGAAFQVVRILQEERLLLQYPECALQPHHALAPRPGGLVAASLDRRLPNPHRIPKSQINYTPA
jgi:hypothetical protein